MDVGGAKGCLIQVEGGLGMTIGQVDAVAICSRVRLTLTPR